MRKSQRSALRLLAVTALVIIASAGTAVPAQAQYIVNATEIGGDVVFEGSGSIDLTAWSYSATDNYARFIAPDYGLGLGTPAADLYTSPISFSGPSVVGPGTVLIQATDYDGDFTALLWGGSTPLLEVPEDYASAQSLAGSALFAGQTFSALGLTPGSYEWIWGSGASVDSFTLNVGAVPVPAAVWLFGSGLLGLVGVARRKARA